MKKRLQTEITEYCPLQESLNGNTFQNSDNISVFFSSSLHDISFVQHNCAYFSQINESAFEQIISVQPCQARYKWDHTTFIDLVLLDIFYISVLYIMQKKKKNQFKCLQNYIKRVNKDSYKALSYELNILLVSAYLDKMFIFEFK